MVESRYHKHIKIFQVYPFNNPVSSTNTKPVVLAGIPYVIFSKYYEQILIISRVTSSPYNDRVCGIKASSKSKYYEGIINFLTQLNVNGVLIEVHQDIVLANLLIKKFKNKIKVNLIKHGPSLYRSFHDKFTIARWFFGKKFLQNLEYVYCISNFVTNSLKRKYPKYATKFITFSNNYGYLNKEDINKDIKKENNSIIFASKPVKFKGFYIFLNAIKLFLSNIKERNITIIGAKFSKKNKYNKALGRLSDWDINIKKHISIYESLANKEVFYKMKESKILVVPSLFLEPFGLVALEGHLAGCIIVSSGTGALKEISGNYAYYIEPLNEHKLLEILNHIANNPKEAEEKAKLGKERALKTFDPKKWVAELDNLRKKILGTFYEK